MQDDLRNIQQEVDSLSKAGTTAKYESQSADKGITDQMGIERPGQRFDSPHRVARHRFGVNVHGA